MSDNVDNISIGQFYSSDYIKNKGLINSRSWNKLYSTKYRSDKNAQDLDVINNGIEDLSEVFEIISIPSSSVSTSIGGKFVNLSNTVITSSDTIIPLTEIESDIADIENNSEITFKYTGKIFLSFILNLEKDSGFTGSINLWFEASTDGGQNWTPIQYSGFFKELDTLNQGAISYSTQINVNSSNKIRIVAFSTGGNITLSTITFPNGVQKAGAIINIANF